MKKDTYYEPYVIESANAIVRVYRPIIDDAERARRMKTIHDSAAKLLSDTDRRRKH